MRIILTDDETAKSKADAKKYVGIRELSDSIVKRVRGLPGGDILLPIEGLVEDMILDWVKEVEKRK